MATTLPVVPTTTNMSVECAPSDCASLERVHFFNGELLTAEDMLQEQRYFRDRLRRHNRLLHGWGTVCGAWVRPANKDWTVVVEKGYLLDPWGNEIVIDREVEVDLRQELHDPCADQLDPWCQQVREECLSGQELYIAVYYAECYTRPVRVHLRGCGCDETECEYSRVRDSFQIKVLREKPEGYPCTIEGRRPSPTHCPESGILDCPPCPKDPGVVIASVKPGRQLIHQAGAKNDGTICEKNINNTRRMAVSLTDYWYCCPATDHSFGQLHTIE